MRTWHQGNHLKLAAGCFAPKAPPSLQLPLTDLVLAAAASLERQSWVTLGSLLQEGFLPVPDGEKVVLSIPPFLRELGYCCLMEPTLQPPIFPRPVWSLEPGRGDFATPYLPSIANHHPGDHQHTICPDFGGL